MNTRAVTVNRGEIVSMYARLQEHPNAGQRNYFETQVVQHREVCTTSRGGRDEDTTMKTARETYYLMKSFVLSRVSGR